MLNLFDEIRNYGGVKHHWKQHSVQCSKQVSAMGNIVALLFTHKLNTTNIRWQTKSPVLE